MNEWMTDTPAVSRKRVMKINRELLLLVNLNKTDRFNPFRSEVTPDVGLAVGAVLPELGPAEGELGLAFLRRGRVLGQELHDVRVVFVAADAAFADDVHDAGQHVAGAAAEATCARRARRFLFLTRVQNLEGTEENRDVRQQHKTAVCWRPLQAAGHYCHNMNKQQQRS